MLQLTDSKSCTQNSRYLPFHDMMYFVPTWSLFAGLVTFNELLKLLYNKMNIEMAGGVVGAIPYEVLDLIFYKVQE